MIENRKADNIC